MTPLTANQLSQGAAQRLGNCVHKRTAPLRDPHQLANAYKWECNVRSIVKEFSSIPIEAPLSDIVDLATAMLFKNEADFIAQTTVNVAEGT